MGRQLALELWVSRFGAKASQTVGVEFEEMSLSPMLRPDPMLSLLTQLNHQHTYRVSLPQWESSAIRGQPACRTRLVPPRFFLSESQ